MRGLFQTVLGVVFGCSQLFAQQVVPIFKTKQDSVTYADLQVRMNHTRELVGGSTPGTAEYDSLVRDLEALITENMKMLTTQVIRMRTIYKPDQTMTSYGSMVRADDL